MFPPWRTDVICKKTGCLTWVSVRSYFELWVGGSPVYIARSPEEPYHVDSRPRCVTGTSEYLWNINIFYKQSSWLYFLTPHSPLARIPLPTRFNKSFPIRWLQMSSHGQGPKPHSKLWGFHAVRASIPVEDWVQSSWSMASVVSIGVHNLFNVRVTNLIQGMWDCMIEWSLLHIEGFSLFLCKYIFSVF